MKKKSSHYAIDEVLFWELKIKQLNKRWIFNYSVPSLKVFSDAGDMGIGIGIMGIVMIKFTIAYVEIWTIN